MAKEYIKGVVITPDGYFVGGIKWRKGAPQPNLNSKNTITGEPITFKLLTDEYAVNNVQPNAKWDFTPVYETQDVEQQEPILDENGDLQFDADGNLVANTVTVQRDVMVRSGTWQLPTEERWLVQQRRDRPNIWFLVNKVLVWPDRLPELNDNQKLIDIAPPPTGARKPSWIDDAGEWRYPRRVAIMDNQGIVQNFVASLEQDDLPVPPGGSFVDAEDTAVLSAEDEKGDVVPCSIGDKIIESGGAITPEILTIPRYQRIPVRLLEQVLTDRNLAANFVAFVQAKGYTINQVRKLGTISLRNKLLREFIIGEGYTLKQAYNALQKAAEALADQEQENEDQVGEEA